MQFAAPGDDKFVGRTAILDAQADVGFQFAVQPRAQLARCGIFALAPGERAGIDAEGHLQRRFGDGNGGQGLGRIDIGDGFTDVGVGDARQGHDITRQGLWHFDALQALVGQDQVDLLAGYHAVAVDVRDKAVGP